jgi:hypothetical protein
VRRYGPGSSFDYATTEPVLERRKRRRGRDSRGRFLPRGVARRRAAVEAVTEETTYVGRHRRVIEDNR